MRGLKFFLLSLALVLSALPAAAQEAVPVRAGGHPDYGRIVFDWPSAVGYQATINGRNLIVRFDRPFTANFSAALGALEDYVAGASVSSDNRTASIRLKGDYTLRDFESGTSIVVDVLRQAPPKPTATTAPRSPAASAPNLRVRKGGHPNYDRLVFDWTRPVEYKVARSGKRITLEFSRSARIDVAQLRARLDRGRGPSG